MIPNKVLRGAFTAIGVAGMAISASPAMAQQQDQLRAFVNMYRVTDYALGANESCDLFMLGDYRALKVLHNSFRSDLSRVLSAEQMAEIETGKVAKANWQGCLNRAEKPQEWELIDTARLMAAALVTAPTRMSVDPKSCKVDGEFHALGKFEWPKAAVVAASDYADHPKKAEYDGLANEMGTMIDGECNRLNVSTLMQPAYETLVQSEDLSLLLQQKLEKKTVATSVGTRASTNPVSGYMGIWRSRRGGFLGTRLSSGLNVYRILDRGDKDVMFFHLSRPGTFDPSGKMFITRKGGWNARLKGNVDQLQMRLSTGDVIAFDKQSGSGSAGMGSSVFVLPAAAQARMAAVDDAVAVSVAYRAGNGDWVSFLDIGRDPAVQKQTMGDIRAGLEWANVPMPAKEDR